MLGAKPPAHALLGLVESTPVRVMDTEVLIGPLGPCEPVVGVTFPASEPVEEDELPLLLDWSAISGSAVVR